MKKQLRKAIVLLCCAALTTGILAGCTPSGAPQSTGGQSAPAPESGTVSAAAPILFEKPVTFSMLTPSHASWPFQEDWYVLDLVKEKTNAEFKITAVDTEGFTEKLNLTMASGDLPDLIYLLTPQLVQQYGSQGAFVNIFEHIDKMPNFKAWYEKNEQYALNYLSADGALYQFPQQGVEETNRRGWLYRADIFEQAGLEVPTNKDEFYNVLVKLKEKHPDSYPLGFRSFVAGLNQFNMIAPSWGTHHIVNEDNRFFGYDYEKNEWVFGPTSDEYKEMVTFYHQLYEEGLLLPNFLTIDTKGWQDVIANSDSFITLDYLSRIDFFNNSMRPSAPEFTMSFMAPSSFGGEGQAMFPNSAKAMMGFVVSSQTKQLDEVLKYVDWMYSEEAKELLTWGRPNELYTQDASGNRKWNDFKTAAEMKQGTGLQAYGFYELYDFNGELSTFTPECRAATEEARKYDLPAQPVLAYTDEEKEVTSTIGTNLQSRVSEEISKFLLGVRSLDEWDAYVAEIEAMGLDKLRAVHESSYARVLAAQKG